jgi:hypothetical protein
LDAAQASGLSARPGEHTGCRTTQGRDTCAASTSAANRDSNAAGPVDTCTRTDDYSAAAASIPGSNSGPVSRRNAAAASRSRTGNQCEPSCRRDTHPVFT